MDRPGSQYFKGRCVCGERVMHYVIWDGVRDYEKVPPLEVLDLVEKMPGQQLHVQVDENAVEDIHEIITAPLDTCPEVGGLVVWTKDHRTYRLIVQQLTALEDHVWLT
jgi:hypothetical protein